MATAEFSKFAGILSTALSQHLSEFEIAQLEFHHQLALFLVMLLLGACIYVDKSKYLLLVIIIISCPLSSFTDFGLKSVLPDTGIVLSYHFHFQEISFPTQSICVFCPKVGLS